MDKKFETKVYDIAPDPSTGKQPICRKCNKGRQHFDFGGPTGYQIYCDNPDCGHTFAVTVGVDH